VENAIEDREKIQNNPKKKRGKGSKASKELHGDREESEHCNCTNENNAKGSHVLKNHSAMLPPFFVLKKKRKNDLGKEREGEGG